MWNLNVFEEVSNMSLDLSFYQVREVCEENFNITHNLGQMADSLGVYKMLWHPEEFPNNTAKDILPKINQAIFELKSNPKQYKQYEASNGWGTIDGFLNFLEMVRSACERYPNARLESSR